MEENRPSKKDEIDLLELFSIFWRGIVKLLKSVIDFIVFLFVFGLFRIHWLLVFAVIGASLGYIVFQNTDRYYSSEMIAQPNGFSSIDMVQYFNDIQEMCERRNMEAISKAFKISFMFGIGVCPI